MPGKQTEAEPSATQQPKASALGIPLYSSKWYVGYPTDVPLYTEARIQQLCKQILAAKSDEDIEGVVPELRAALEEHIRLAKDSLRVQRINIAALDAATGIKTTPPTE
jgi:hypothetical protein